MKEFITSLINHTLKNLLYNKKAKQVGALYSSLILSLIIGIGTSVVTTRFLGPQQFGDFKFLQNLFSFVVTFLTAGIFFSGSTLLAQKKNEPIKQYLLGSLCVFALTVSAVFTFGMFIFSFFEEQIFNNQLGALIRIFSPLLFVFPFQLCLENIMQGDNRIYDLAFFRTGPQALYLITVLMYNYFIPLALTAAFFIQFLTFAFFILLAIIRLKPRFNDISTYCSIIWKQNKTYGLHVYTGSISGVATAYLGGLSIAYFIDTISVGLYSLALTITMPLTIIPTAVGTAFYKEFANSGSISKKVTTVTLLLSIFSLLVFCLIIKKVVLVLYSSAYVASVPLAYLLSLGSVFHGFGDFYNRFLGAHGCGTELRNSAIMVGVSNVIGYMVFVYMFGVMGAAVTRVFSSMFYLCMMYYFYLKTKKRIAAVALQ